MPVYLISTETDAEKAIGALFDEFAPLRPGLALVESEESQSRVYHDIKWALPDGASLFVARLDHQPKFKGVREGALKWVRERYDGMTA